MIEVAEVPGGSSCRTVVEIGRFPSLRTWIRYLGAAVLSGATCTVTGGFGGGTAARVGLGSAGGADGRPGPAEGSDGWPAGAVAAA